MPRDRHPFAVIALALSSCSNAPHPTIAPVPTTFVAGPAAPPPESPKPAALPPAPCGDEPVELARHESLLGLAVSADRVCWTDAGRGSIWSVPKAGGEPLLLARTPLAPQNLVVVDKEAIWIEYGSVSAVPVTGGKERPIAVGRGSTMGIARSGSSLFVMNLDEDTISEVPITGEAARAVAKGPMSIRIAAHDRALLFWKVIAPHDFALTLQVADRTSVLFDSASHPGPIALDASAAYFDAGSGIQRVKRTGGAPQSITSEGSREFALDGDTIFFTTPAGELKRVRVAGGAPVTLASAEPHFAARVAVDDRCVYFAAKGRIMKVAKGTAGRP